MEDELFCLCPAPPPPPAPPRKKEKPNQPNPVCMVYLRKEVL